MPGLDKTTYKSTGKVRASHDQRNHVICKIKLRGCNGYYIGKTERSLITTINEHDTKETEHLFKSLSECEMRKEC